MKIKQVFDFDTMPVNFRSACDIRRACRPMWLSPISPSSSALGTSAATESTTSTSICPEASGQIDVLVVDSVAALVPKAELEGEMGDSHMGLQARLMSQALRKLTGSISRTHCTVIFINQIR